MDPVENANDGGNNSSVADEEKDAGSRDPKKKGLVSYKLSQ